MIVLFIGVVATLARSSAIVSHSCVLFADTPVYRVDRDGGTLFYVIEEVSYHERWAERKYCLQMTSAFSEISDPKKFVCRECLLETETNDPKPRLMHDALAAFVCATVCVAIVFMLCDIFACQGDDEVGNMEPQISTPEKKMTQIHGIEHYSQEVKDFVEKQFALHGTIGTLEFRRCSDGVGFQLSSFTPTDDDPEDVYLCGSEFVAVKVTNDGNIFRDLYTLRFSKERPRLPTKTDSVAELKKDNKHSPAKVASTSVGTLVSGSWNGHPMSDEISPRDALFAVCTMDGVFINGQRLVLRDGKWHMPKK